MCGQGRDCCEPELLDAMGANPDGSGVHGAVELARRSWRQWEHKYTTYLPRVDTTKLRCILIKRQCMPPPVDIVRTGPAFCATSSYNQDMVSLNDTYVSGYRNSLNGDSAFTYQGTRGTRIATE